LNGNRFWVTCNSSSTWPTVFLCYRIFSNNKTA
jgi:hypothetical protein